MDCSTAIRLGAQRLPQCLGLFEHDTIVNFPRRYKLRAACALGAAYLHITDYEFLEHPETLAMLVDNNDSVYKKLIETFPILSQEFSGQCPGQAFKSCNNCRSWRRDVLTAVIHLNDYHCWTRERIADWLDTL